jgi:ketosteroid isomerase-like protein
MNTQNQALKLPEPIRLYWEATNARQPEAACASFTPDATVLDEGETLSGSPAILSWIAETTEKYQPVVEPLRMRESDGKHLVTARVSGTFPGSPVEIEFAFTLREGKIACLEIQ